MAGPRRPYDTLGHGGVGHHCRRVGNLRADSMQILDALVLPFPEEVPHGSLGRDNIRLITAVGDHIMRTVFGTNVLAAEVPADVHQLHAIECASTRPRR